MTTLIQLLTFILPWVFLRHAEDPWMEPKEVTWLVGCWLILLWGTFRNATTTRWTNRAVYWFAAWCLGLGIMHFYWPYISRLRDETHIIYNIYQWIPVVYILTACVTVRVLAHWCSQGNHATVLTRWVCLSATAVAVYAMLQYLGIDQWYRARANWAWNDHWMSMTAGFGNPGTTSTFLALTLPLFFCFRDRRALLGLALCLAVIFLVQVRYSWGMTGVSLFVYGLLRYYPTWTRRWRFVVVGICLIMGCVGVRWLTQALPRDERWMIWQETLYQWNPDPHVYAPVMTGHGLQSFPELFLYHKTALRADTQVKLHTKWLWAFNDWIQGLYELGLLGVGLAFWMVSSAFRSGWRFHHTVIGAAWWSCAVSLMVATLIFSPWHFAPIAWIGMLIWSMLERSSEGLVSCQK